MTVQGTMPLYKPLVSKVCELPTRGPPVFAKHSHATESSRDKLEPPRCEFGSLINFSPARLPGAATREGG